MKDNDKEENTAAHDSTLEAASRVGDSPETTKVFLVCPEEPLSMALKKHSIQTVSL